MVNIELKADFSKVVLASKEIEREVLSDISDFWGTCKPVVIKSLIERFRTENWKRWAPLSKKYKAWKDKHYPGMPILQRTRQLFKAATKQGTDGNVCIEEAMWMSWGVDRVTVPQAAYVQDAKTSRIWCELEEKQEKVIHKYFAVWLRKRLNTIYQRHR